MSSIVCPSCGANLDAGARFCASCGQPVGGPAGVPGQPTPPGAAAGKKVPVLPIAIFGGGLIALVGVLAYMRTNAPPSGGAVPVPAPSAASSAAPAAPLSGAPAPTPFAEAPATQPGPASNSALSFPDTLPPSSPSSGISGAGTGSAPAAPPAANRVPSTKAWKDPLAAESAAPPPQKAPVRVAAAARPAPPQALPSRPAPPSAPSISQTYDCRENATFNITPEDINISVDGQSIGTADRWDGANEGRKYTFRSPGAHVVKLSHEGYETVWIRIEVGERSIYRTADVDLQMKRLGR